jgi:hypothetical protein
VALTSDLDAHHADAPLQPIEKLEPSKQDFDFSIVDVHGCLSR